MFDMAKWDEYLDEYRCNAKKAGATSIDVLQLLHMANGREVVVAKAEEEMRDANLIR